MVRPTHLIDPRGFVSPVWSRLEPGVKISARTPTMCGLGRSGNKPNYKMVTRSPGTATCTKCRTAYSRMGVREFRDAVNEAIRAHESLARGAGSLEPEDFLGWHISKIGRSPTTVRAELPGSTFEIKLHDLNDLGVVKDAIRGIVMRLMLTRGWTLEHRPGVWCGLKPGRPPVEVKHPAGLDDLLAALQVQTGP